MCVCVDVRILATTITITIILIANTNKWVSVNILFDLEWRIEQTNEDVE